MRRALVLLMAAFWLVAFDPFRTAGIDPRPDARVPLEGTFLEADGHAVSLADLAAGKPLVLVPVLHRCPNICGATLAGLAQAIAAQRLRPGRDFTLVAFGIDPREGPAEASADLADLRHAVPALGPEGIHALTGAKDQIRAVTDALGYRYAWDDRIQQYAHVAAVAVLQPDGRLNHWLYGLAPAPDELTRAVMEATQRDPETWGQRILLLCFHYDPMTGRNGPLIWTLLRAVGALVVLGGGGWIAWAVGRDRRPVGPS
ncbi:protein SCO1/2 [Nitrospirillum amazonense]|uniref:Protein SCO1/2 n=1 Tax=Nitrospirillum amazonense TaxID=28077 RepID=A0A560EST3_9PROT|nr:SCO family protein [Nitrospirillum amazonense]TWB12431.1 protein SCO1/2 [Nitrospirillum amazonense]